MLQGEHSAILSTFIKLPFAIKIFVLSIFERPLKTGFNKKNKDLPGSFFSIIGLSGKEGQVIFTPYGC